MEERATKFCKMCCKEIDEKARKCPFCHHWQNKYLMFLLHPVIVIIPIALFLISIPYIFISMFDPGEDFDIYKTNVKIVESKFEFGENKCGSSIVVLGK